MEKSITPRGLRRLCRTLAIAAEADVMPDKGLVLDAGCNSGVLSSMIEGLTVVGVDIELGGANVRADLRFLPYRDKTFQLIFCLEVLEHIVGWERAFEELLRVGRRLVVSVPYRERIISIQCPRCNRGTSPDGHVNIYDEVSFSFRGLEPVIKYIYSTSRWSELLVREAGIIFRKYILRRKEGVNKKTKCVHCGHTFSYFIKKELLRARLGKFFRREPDWIVFIF